MIKLAGLFALSGKRSKGSERGAVTVEAALTLPVFVCVVISIIFLVRIVYTYEMEQYAISKTADEMASAGYIFHISGLGKLNSQLDRGMEDWAEVFREHLDTVFEGLDSIGNLFKAGEAIGDIASNPLDELKSAAFFLAGNVYDDIKTQFFTPLVTGHMGKYLISGSGQDVDMRLKALNIQDGLNGFDFSESSFFTGEGNDIDIVVKYRLNLPVPLKLLPDLNIIQRASSRAWTVGDKREETLNPEDVDDIWSLDNLSRGRKIRAIFGENLPFNYPVIAKFQDGTATMIKSMDLTAESYKTGKNITDTLEGYLSELAAFKGREEPWGSKKILIRQQDIKQKVLLLVIPKNQLNSDTEARLESFKDHALTMGIKPVIERYGTKGGV